MINTTEKATQIKAEVLDVSIKNNQGHVAPSLSCLDILTVLHYHSADPADTIILSKGHGCYALYAIQADLQEIPLEQWETFKLPGCLDGYGSLGHGLPVAVGVAFANKELKNNKHTWVIVGDGELQEGSCWEALNFMQHHKLDNITVIVDCNGFQAMAKVNDVMRQDLSRRFDGWGFETWECDGHNHETLKYAFAEKPKIILANTIKGKGISYMENKAEWHYKVPYDKS
jgi:transketolase